jgi:hypothetical protein
VNEIASASKEQHLGIDHLNQAMLEIDHVVQQNAANAEESASAAAQLQAQAERLRDIVGEVTSLVGGSDNLSLLGAAAPGKGQQGQLTVSPAGGGLSSKEGRRTDLAPL